MAWIVFRAIATAARPGTCAPDRGHRGGSRRPLRRRRPRTRPHPRLGQRTGHARRVRGLRMPVLRAGRGRDPRAARILRRRPPLRLAPPSAERRPPARADGGRGGGGRGRPGRLLGDARQADQPPGRVGTLSTSGATRRRSASTSSASGTSSAAACMPREWPRTWRARTRAASPARPASSSTEGATRAPTTSRPSRKRCRRRGTASGSGSSRPPVSCGDRGRTVSARLLSASAGENNGAGVRRGDEGKGHHSSSPDRDGGGRRGRSRFAGERSRGGHQLVTLCRRDRRRRRPRGPHRGAPDHQSRPLGAGARSPRPGRRSRPHPLAGPRRLCRARGHVHRPHAGPHQGAGKRDRRRHVPDLQHRQQRLLGKRAAPRVPERHAVRHGAAGPGRGRRHRAGRGPARRDVPGRSGRQSVELVQRRGVGPADARHLAARAHERQRGVHGGHVRRHRGDLRLRAPGRLPPLHPLLHRGIGERAEPGHVRAQLQHRRTALRRRASPEGRRRCRCGWPPSSASGSC